MARSRKQGEGTPVSDAPDPDAEKRKNDAAEDFVRQMRELHEERNEINGRLSEVRQAAKDAGLNSRVLEKVAKDSLKDEETVAKERLFENAVRSLKEQLGQLFGTPLGMAAAGAAE